MCIRDRPGAFPASFAGSAIPAGATLSALAVRPAGGPALLVLWQGLLHGKADFALLVDGEHLDLYRLPFGDKIADLCDKGGGDL